MRPAYALTLFGWCILCSGCALIEDGSRNVCVALSTPIETHRENARNRKWAEAAWQKVCFSSGIGPRTEDYARGFKDGYAEYLYRGGDGEPPLIAPLRYRHFRYQTENGYRAIEDWFAGYRHGASVARDTGARNWVTGPSGLHMDAPVPSDAPPHRIDEPVQELPPPVILKPVQATNEDMPPSPLPLGPLLDAPPAREPMIEPPAPEPESVKIKILNIQAPAPLLDTTRARITGISVSGPTLEPPALPVRARITTITVAPSKD